MTPRGRVLAIDYGEKRVGLALSDPLRIFAKPYLVVPNTGFKPLVARLTGIIESQQVGLVVLGMPYAIEGGDTLKTTETKAFKLKLEKRLDVPVVAWDERYSTADAISELIKLGYGWKERRQLQDAMAATVILKDYLESLRREP